MHRKIIAVDPEPAIRELPLFLARAREAIRPEGLFLFSDHYDEPGTRKNADLFVTQDEQPML
jgi:hypothetical protein